MYSTDEGGCCLKLLGGIGSLLGIIAAVVTILAYFYPDRAEFYDAVNDISQVNVEPAFDFFEDVRLDIVNFSDDHRYVPIIIAVLLVLVSVGYGSVASEEWDTYSIGGAVLAGVVVFLVVLPCTLCWIWLYSDMASETR